MLWLKAAHLFGVIAWFAGLFYLPRLFVYHAEADDAPGRARFVIMERRLYVMMNIGAAIALAGGMGMLIGAPGYLAMGWLHVKLVLVALLVAYHAYCFKLLRDFATGANRRSARWYRLFNELPALILIGIVILAVVRPF
jgi:putative membrane protein